ncbi:MAG: hypothetical protein HY700_22255 [Gemmatimonadetes bacterium]|nr:hypothetical protein [Gemmatimonadota bacterium]
MRKLLTIGLASAALGMAACSENTAPNSDPVAGNPLSGMVTPGNPASAQTAAAVLSVVDQSGWSAADFGAVGATSEFENAGETWATSTYRSPTAAVAVPEFWGRLRGEPVSRTREVTEKGDTAWASIRVDYNGAFLLDLTPGNGRLDVTSKPLVESMVQRARLEKGPANEKGYRNWVLVGITPQQYVATNPAQQTVKITEVAVSVNGTVKIDITDPAAFEKIVNGTGAGREAVPLFTRGDTVKVTAKVANTTGTGNTPPTFAFLSSFHADPNGLGWRRMLMHDDGDGSFSLSWVAAQKGRERIIVEALDAQSFVTPTADDYRANVWAVPYQIQ